VKLARKVVMNLIANIHQKEHVIVMNNIFIALSSLTPKGPGTIFKPFLKFGQAIVKAIVIKNS
jgi:hypothetical protein